MYSIYIGDNLVCSSTSLDDVMRMAMRIAIDNKGRVITVSDRDLVITIKYG